MAFVISANRLRDGSVVYLTENSQWSARVEEATVVSGDSLADAQRIGCEAEGRNLVVGSYAVEVAPDSAILPVKLRERIRSHGPTVGDHQSRLPNGPEG